MIGADGVSSTISRAIGNTLKDGALAVSVRAYYRDVVCDGAPDEGLLRPRLFPGLRLAFRRRRRLCQHRTWLRLTTRTSRCCKILAHASTASLPTDLAPMLAKATRCGPVSGGSSGFFRPKSIVGDGVMLIGDAANQADPLNGGGIHKAMESAYCAAEACHYALSIGDFSRHTMQRYEDLWSQRYEADWRTAEIFMSIAKNPDLRDFSLFLLTQIGKLTIADPRSATSPAASSAGVISQRCTGCVSARALSRLSEGPRHLDGPA